MELIKSNTIRSLSNPGVTSRQILNPDNSESRRITITEVHLEPGACQPRHRHETSEQIWYVLSGHGKLLLSDEQEQSFNAGDAVRFADGDIHGLKNTGPEPFIYLSVTSPPIHFGYAYQQK